MKRRDFVASTLALAGGGYLKVYQVKGNEWVPVSDWIRGYREEVMALVKKANAN